MREVNSPWIWMELSCWFRSKKRRTLDMPFMDKVLLFLFSLFFVFTVFCFYCFWVLLKSAAAGDRKLLLDLTLLIDKVHFVIEVYNRADMYRDNTHFISDLN